jgi:hypothetical protein
MLALLTDNVGNLMLAEGLAQAALVFALPLELTVSTRFRT